jgi:nucleoid DNA-binding protein
MVKKLDEEKKVLKNGKAVSMKEASKASKVVDDDDDDEEDDDEEEDGDDEEEEEEEAPKKTVKKAASKKVVDDDDDDEEDDDEEEDGDDEEEEEEAPKKSSKKEVKKAAPKKVVDDDDDDEEEEAPKKSSKKEVKKAAPKKVKGKAAKKEAAADPTASDIIRKNLQNYLRKECDIEMGLDDIRLFLSGFADELVKLAKKGGKVQIKGNKYPISLYFKSVIEPEHEGRNPKTEETIIVPERIILKSKVVNISKVLDPNWGTIAKAAPKKAKKK